VTYNPELLAKILGRLGSDADGEVLAAAKLAIEHLKRAQLEWSQVLVPRNYHRGHAYPQAPNPFHRWNPADGADFRYQTHTDPADKDDEGWTTKEKPREGEARTGPWSRSYSAEDIWEATRKWKADQEARRRADQASNKTERVWNKYGFNFADDLRSDARRQAGERAADRMSAAADEAPRVDFEELAHAASTYYAIERFLAFEKAEPQLAFWLFTNRHKNKFTRALFKRVCDEGDLDAPEKNLLREHMLKS
jgi:hypothetical protein